jgi:hypothetical protein
MRERLPGSDNGMGCCGCIIVATKVFLPRPASYQQHPKIIAAKSHRWPVLLHRLYPCQY